MPKYFASCSFEQGTTEFHHGIFDDSFTTAFWDEDTARMELLKVGETLDLSDDYEAFFVTRIA